MADAMISPLASNAEAGIVHYDAFPTKNMTGENVIGFLTFGINDLAKVAEYYDAFLATNGAKRSIGWASSPTSAGLGLAKPVDGKAATVGNGVMVALVGDGRKKVDALYKKAMELCASGKGPPGPRGTGFYAGYFRDPKGNKLNAFCMG